jgi:glycosyltransferase involved in cell wall biosynthesis
MRVVVISHLYPSPGHERHLFVHEQAAALKRLGVEIAVVSPTAYSFGMARLHPKLRQRRATPRVAERDGVVARYPRVPVLPRRMLFQHSGDLYYLGLHRCVAGLRGRSVDLIHAHQAMPDGAAAQRVAAALGVPYVVTVHGADVYQHLRLGGAVADRTRAVLSGAVAVVGVSSKVTSLLAGTVPEERLYVNLNGVVGSLERVQPADFLPGRPLLLTVAYLITRKGHAVVLDALKRLRDEGLDPAWAVVGDGPLLEDLRGSAAEAGLADAVHFLGRRTHDEVLALMARAELFVLPSWDEAFGLVYTEAMIQETPIIACRGEGVEDFIADGESGYLVAPRDAAALAAVIGSALRDDEARRLVGRTGREVAAQLTWARNAEQQLRIYEAVT